MELPTRLLGAALLTFSTLIAGGGSAAQKAQITFTVEIPNTTENPDVFLAGNFQGWDPGDRRFAMQRSADGLYLLTIESEVGRNLQFKFTMGSWDVVEKGPGGEEIANRTLHVTGSATHHFAVASWADPGNAAPARHTLTGDVRRLEPSPFPDGRPVWVYLPPGYDAAPQRRYPVLYMWDGQNVFDAATSFAGEWEVDETCERLIAEGRITPLIVVALSNGRGDRSLEYTPWPDPDFQRGASGGGRDHLRLVVNEVIPRIEARFRTLDGPHHRGLAGSSFGGLMTILGAGEHTGTFGRFGIFSPSLWWHHEQPNAFAAQRLSHGSRIYIDMGGRENNLVEDGDGNGVDDSLDQLRRFVQTLVKKGHATGEDLMVVEDAEGRHHESSWARRLPAALEFLFPPE